MCGIMGYIGGKDAADVIIDGLIRQEYRGYDSAGVVMRDSGGTNELKVIKTVGRVSSLAERVKGVEMKSVSGVGHTRWATHGGVSEVNAHPHESSDGRVVLVHNGIIENSQEIRARLEARGIKFVTDTDTESAAQLLAYYYKGDPLEAIVELCREIRGAYAFVIMFKDLPDEIWCARKGSPLVLASSAEDGGEGFCASDPAALLKYSRDLFFMDEGDIARITRGKCSFYAPDGSPIEKESVHADWDVKMVDKGGFAHFMRKEISEQPDVVRRTLVGRVDGSSVAMEGDISLSAEDAKALRRLHFIACGTSFYAALVARNVMESIGCDLDIRTEIASEYRYHRIPGGPDTMAIFVSQSGETADTLAAARVAKSRGITRVALTNVRGSTIDRESDFTLISQAGPEIGVAATKTFMGQITLLTLLGLHIAKLRGELARADEERIVNELARLPEKIEAIIEKEAEISRIAGKYFHLNGFFFIGRGSAVPVAMEGALKMKEISYLPSEAYPAGEMKHGPIAMLDERLPVVAITPESSLKEKMLSNVEECMARKAPIVLVATEGDESVARYASDIIAIPATEEETLPFLGVVPMQLLAYHTALCRGCDIDMPRNLAKSVTVE